MSAKLRPNPFSHVTLRHSGGGPVELRVWSATRSRGAVTRNYSRETCPNFERLCRVAALARLPEGRATQPSIEDYVALASLGLWAPDTDLIDPILLEAPITALGAASDASSGPDDFALRGDIWLQHGSDPCEPARHLPLACLSDARPILWHRGSALEPLLPWWPDPACLAALAAMQRGSPLQADMLPALQALADQGIVARPGPAARRPAIDLAAERELFAREGFVKLPQMLPPGQIAALRAYWRKLAALDVFPPRGDNRHGSHGEPSSTVLLYMMKPLIEHIVGAPIEPAFSYSWFYDRGTEMPRHRDRAESSYTVSFLIDYAPAIDGPIPWPLCICPRSRDAPVEIRQSIGDGLLFCGGELEHFRPPFTMGDRSTSLLLHYVDKSFTGALF